MDSPAVSLRLFPTTLTFRTPQENHIVSVPFETIEKTKKCFFSIFVSPGHLETIQNLIPGWTTIVKLLKQVKNWQGPSRDPWSNCLINSREDDKGQSYYYSGGQKDNSKTICGRAGYELLRYDLQDFCKLYQDFETGFCGVIFTTSRVCMNAPRMFRTVPMNNRDSHDTVDAM